MCPTTNQKRLRRIRKKNLPPKNYRFLKNEKRNKKRKFKTKLPQGFFKAFGVFFFRNTDFFSFFYYFDFGVINKLIFVYTFI